MTDSTSTRLDNFGDIVSVVENRANITGTAQDRDRNLIKGAVNEFYQIICTERNWVWRKFDRDIVFDVAVTTGTVAVTNGSRVATFTGLTLTEAHRGRSLKIDGVTELYRIIGIDTSANAALLAANYIGATVAAATFHLYQYEFALPPDCDTVSQLYIDTGYFSSSGDYGVLEERNVLEFNRFLSGANTYKGIPLFYTRDGKINANSSPPLDVMVLNYDFLLGSDDDDLEKLRVFPIEPDAARLLHLNYSVLVADLVADADVPLIPKDNRWMLVHYALFVWHSKNGSGTMADREMAMANKMLKEMRDEHQKTDVKPKFVIRKDKFRRQHGILDNREDLFIISRDY